MRLNELDPHWLFFDGRRVGFIFRCPLPGKGDWWQTCFVEKFFLFKGRDGEHASDEEAYSPDSQGGVVRASFPQALNWFQPCNPSHQWTVAGGIENATFESLTVTPSLDGSAGGLWHGFIQGGQIVGGLPCSA